MILKSGSTVPLIIIISGKFPILLISLDVLISIWGKGLSKRSTGGILGLGGGNNAVTGGQDLHQALKIKLPEEHIVQYFSLLKI